MCHGRPCASPCFIALRCLQVATSATVRLLTGFASALPPPVPSNLARSIAAHEWVLPTHPVYEQALTKQATKTGGLCWASGLDLPLPQLAPIVLWVVDPLNRLAAATGVALVEKRLQRLLGSAWWFGAQDCEEVGSVSTQLKCVHQCSSDEWIFQCCVHCK
jgi:hypothetical protein